MSLGQNFPLEGVGRWYLAIEMLLVCWQGCLTLLSFEEGGGSGNLTWQGCKERGLHCRDVAEDGSFHSEYVEWYCWEGCQKSG